MKAEDVDAALVEKAAKAMWSIPPQDPDSAMAWPSWDVAVERADAGLWDLPQMVADTRNLVRHALAAVLPEAYAEAIEHVAKRISPNSGIGLADGATRGDVAVWLLEYAAALRAKGGEGAS